VSDPDPCFVGISDADLVGLQYAARAGADESDREFVRGYLAGTGSA
jgi:hypothetical protein